MNKVFSRIYLILITFVMIVCQGDEVNAMPPTDLGNTADGDARTLIV